MRTVAAVIPSFEPGDDLVDGVKAVVNQVDHVWIIDDGSPSLRGRFPDRVRGVLEMCESLGASIIELPDNGGIARALNTGVTAALQSGVDAVLTLDQDTVLEGDYVVKFLAHLDLAVGLGVDDVMLSPSEINDMVAPFWFAHRGLTLAFEPLQSGMLFPRSLFEKIGLFEDDLFIDCVETEFYLRARAHGAHALIVPGTRIQHSLGQQTSWAVPRPLRWLLRGRGGGGAIDFSEDAPFRHYYIARNRMCLYQRYWRTEPLWCAVSVAKDVLSRGRAMLIGSQRPSRIYLTAAGLRAWARGETGKIPDRTMQRSRRRRHKAQKPVERRARTEPRQPEWVSVIIPAYDAAAVIDQQLEALAAQDYRGGFEVLVCDNGSHDGLKAKILSHPLADELQLRWVDAADRPGAGHARNVGASVAKGDLLVFCDADDRASNERWLTELVAVAAFHDVVGGALETESLNSPEVCGWRGVLPPEQPHEIYRFMPVTPSANLAVWRERFEQVQGFDTSYVRGGEDSDFVLRVQLGGGSFGHAAKALMGYRLRDSLRSLWGQSVMCGEGDVRLYSDYRAYGMPRKPWYALVDTVLYVAVRNPLLPSAVTGVPTGRWLFHAGNLVGRIKGSIRHRVFYV